MTARNSTSSLPGSGDFPAVGPSLELLDKAKDGDLGALNDLFARYQDRLRRIVRVRMGGQIRRWMESMDIVQDTYRVAMRKLPEFEPQDTASLLHWLSAIAMNQIRDAATYNLAQKRDRRREVPLARGSNSPDGGDRRAPSEDPARGMLMEEIREILDEAVCRLPEDQREVVLLRDYYGCIWSDVALKLRRSVPAVRQLRQRAWIHLRRVAGPQLEAARSTTAKRSDGVQ